MACMYSREVVKCRIFVVFNISYSGLSVSSERIHVMLLHFSKTYKVLVFENMNFRKLSKIDIFEGFFRIFENFENFENIENFENKIFGGNPTYRV